MKAHVNAINHILSLSLRFMSMFFLIDTSLCRCRCFQTSFSLPVCSLVFEMLQCRYSYYVCLQWVGGYRGSGDFFVLHKTPTPTSYPEQNVMLGSNPFKGQSRRCTVTGSPWNDLCMGMSETCSLQMWALAPSLPVLNISASGGCLPLHLNGKSLERVLMGLLVAILF